MPELKKPGNKRQEDGVIIFIPSFFRYRRKQMNIRQVITDVDNDKPNQYQYEKKIEWLNSLETMIYKEIILTHEGNENIKFSGYTDGTDGDTVLIVPEPYSKLYKEYLEAQIDYKNQEIDRYNNSMAMFNFSYQEFANYWNRTHMPISNQEIKV